MRSASATTLKFIPYADLALLDPLVSAFVTRNHVMMVFDTLFALDAAGNAQYQMLDTRCWPATRWMPGANMQRQAFVDAPFMPLGLDYQPVAYRNDLSGMMKGLILFTGVRRW